MKQNGQMLFVGFPMHPWHRPDSPFLALREHDSLADVILHWRNQLHENRSSSRPRRPFLLRTSSRNCINSIHQYISDIFFMRIKTLKQLNENKLFCVDEGSQLDVNIADDDVPYRLIADDVANVLERGEKPKTIGHDGNERWVVLCCVDHF